MAFPGFMKPEENLLAFMNHAAQFPNEKDSLPEGKLIFSEQKGKMTMEKGRRRIFAILIALIYLLAAQAFGESVTWDCPECGKNGNIGNFCGSCGHPAPWNESEVQTGNKTETKSPEQDTPSAAAMTAEPPQITGYGKTIEEDVYVRNWPGSGSVIVDALPKGEVVFVSAQVYMDGNAWHQIQYNGKEGYIQANILRMMSEDEVSAYLGQQNATPEPEITAKSDDSKSLSGFGYTTLMVNIRGEARTGSEKIQLLKKYALCQVLDITQVDGETWYQVAYGGKTGYVNGRYFKQMTRTELNVFMTSEDYLEGLRANAETPTLVPTETTEPTQVPGPKGITAVGDIITFGHYEQDNNLNNGQEQIEWIVLEYDAAGKKALLLSRYGLDAKPYYKTDMNITWGLCSLRTWLNGEFLKKAFTAEEQGTIWKTFVDNSKNQGYSGYNTDGGQNTEDRIFLLSYHEAFEMFFTDNQSRICKSTAFAQQQGCFMNLGKGYWWLRSPGDDQRSAAIVYGAGLLSSRPVYSDDVCVRPALWLNLDSGIF